MSVTTTIRPPPCLAFQRGCDKNPTEFCIHGKGNKPSFFLFFSVRLNVEKMWFLGRKKNCRFFAGARIRKSPIPSILKACLSIRCWICSFRRKYPWWISYLVSSVSVSAAEGKKNPNNQQETANKNTPDDSRSKVKVLFSRENSVGKYNPSKGNSGRVVPKNALK